MRISLVAGPGSGKSTSAAKIFAHFKSQFRSIELVHEYVKEWAYIGRKPEGFDQYFISANQLHSEFKPLKAGVKNIVTDSPVVLGAFYAKAYGISYWKELLTISNMFDQEYKNTYYFINRNDRQYVTHGRYESYEQAKERDIAIKNFLNENKISYIEVDSAEEIIYNAEKILE